MKVIRAVGHNIKTRLLFPIIDNYRNRQFEKLVSENSNQIAINQDSRKQKILVSLTTVPSRIHIIEKSLESACRQTIKPDAIIVNLGEELFKDALLPDFIKRYEDRGVTVNYVHDIGPHTKYYHVMKQYPNDLIITMDDDILYDSKMIERLLDMHERYPEAVCANRAHVITFNGDGKMLPYNSWIDAGYVGPEPSSLYLATGVGGVLYPPGCMDEDLFNEELIRKLSFKADDIWLKWMQLKKGTKVISRRALIKHLSEASDSQREALSLENVNNSRNDEYIKKIIKYYDIDDSVVMAGKF